jgi:hypothetical protein
MAASMHPGLKPVRRRAGAPHARTAKVILLFGWAALPTGARAFEAVSGGGEITAVSAKVFNGYSRVRLADGSFRPEHYGFAIGGLVPCSEAGLEDSETVFTRDDTIDDMAFAPIGRLVQGALAAQKFLPTPDRNAADLVIAVFWGRTIGSSAQTGSRLNTSLLGMDQDRIDAHNAGLLGFDSDGAFGEGFGSSIASALVKQQHSIVMTEIKADRYYVILRAYDFHSEWRKSKNPRLLWETRFSLSQRRHDFGRDLPAMLRAASPYFGQDSGGLVRRSIPLGRVDIGDVRSIGTPPEK